MEQLLTFQNFGNLIMLIFLQAVLGFDNLLYISIESKNAPLKQQAKVRQIGILIAVGLRVVLLFVMLSLLDSLKEPWFSIHWPGLLEGEFTFAVIVFLFGGAFIMYTAVKEIAHMLAIHDLTTEETARKKQSARKVIAMIVFMNLIFSFDSILSAIAITTVFPVLAGAIIASGLAMLLVADQVAQFLNKHRMYEVLGLFILLIVGIVLLGEGGHKAHLQLFGYHVEPMAKTTFYFSISVLFIVELIQTNYQAKLNLIRKPRPPRK